MGLWALGLGVLCFVTTPAIAESADGSAPHVMTGYIFQTMLTQGSYLITNADELANFVKTLAPVTPYKILPAPLNPDPFLHGFTVDFDHDVLAVAVGRDTITRLPYFDGVNFINGERVVNFQLPAKTAQPYPLGWAVYTAVVLPRSREMTRIIVTEFSSGR